MGNQAGFSSDWSPKIAVCVGTVGLHKQRVLFVRQALGHSLEGQWSIPWGLVDPEEAPEAAALRETREESGVAARLEGLLGVQNLQQDGWMALVYLCSHLSGEPVSDGGHETDRAAYFSIQEMDNFDEPFETLCEWLVRRVLRGDYRVIPLELENPYQPRQAFF